MKQGKVEKRDTVLILSFCFLLIASCVVFHISLIWGFWAAVVFSMALLKRKGFSGQFLIRVFWEALEECKKLYLLLLLIGATVSVWLSSGVVPVMMYYGFEYMQGINFLLAAFVITSIASIFIGTAVGTISTIGIALLGVGKGFGIPDEILLGVIVSGAYIADKLSPVSGLLNLILTSTRTNYRQVLRRMLVTLLPTYLIVMGAYYLIGKSYGASPTVGGFAPLQHAIENDFFVSLWLLLLPAGVIFLTICGLDILLTILFGIIGGGIFSVWIQKDSLLTLGKALFFGYKGSTSSEMLNQILQGGGIISMLEVVCIIMGAVALSSLFEKSGLIEPLIGEFIGRIHTKKTLIFRTGFLSSLLTLLTCDQIVGVLMPVKLLEEKYDIFGLDRSFLARTVSDTGVVVAPLFPWNINALIVGMITGVAAVDYWPYAILCYLFPVLTMIASQLHFQGKGAALQDVS